METRAQTPGWSRTGCWSRNKRRLSLALRRPITAQTLPPFNYTVMPSVQCRRKRSFRPSRWQKKTKKPPHRHAEPWQSERRSSWKHWPCGCRDNPAQLTNISYGWETRCCCHGGSGAYLGWRLRCLGTVLTEQKAIVAPIVFTYSKKFSVSVEGDGK